jgi:hypothetical protein
MIVRFMFGIWLALWLLTGVAQYALANGLQSATQPPGSQQNSTPATAPADAARQTTSPASPAAKSAPSSTPCHPAPQGAASKNSGCAQSAHPPKKKKIAGKPTATAETGPTKTVVRNGSTTDATVSLSPGVSQQEANNLQDTNQLLSKSEANLRELAGRQLSSAQQDTVKQIRNYMGEAKQAADGGDLQRAHNLAYKAELLSAELAGP